MTLTSKWRSWSSSVGDISRGRIWLNSGPAPNSRALSVICRNAAWTKPENLPIKLRKQHWTIIKWALTKLKCNWLHPQASRRLSQPPQNYFKQFHADLLKHRCVMTNTVLLVPRSSVFRRCITSELILAPFGKQLHSPCLHPGSLVLGQFREFAEKSVAKMLKDKT